MLTLILGGARSGKSAYTENLVLNSGLKPVYVATATAGDAEMQSRIRHHRMRRSRLWTTVEEPLELGRCIAGMDQADRFIMIDCLTLWLTKVMAEKSVEAEIDSLVDVLQSSHCPIVMVSNEVGSGLVPANALARRFIDHAGRMHQKIARICDSVVLIVAGLPLQLKSPPDNR